MATKRPKLFYGWWLVVASFVISAYTGGVVFLGFTAIFDPITAEFGWSRTQIAFAASLPGLESGLLAPLAGFLVDRFGSRKLLVSGAVMTGAGLMLLARVNSLFAFYAAFVLVSAGVSICGTTVLFPVVVNWFRRRVSLASGIVACGFGMGGVFVPVVAALIDSLGWRLAMVVLGGGMFALILPLSLMVRHRPEEMGYVPDGEPAVAAATQPQAGNVARGEPEMGVGEALRSRAFWHISLGLMLQLLVINAVIIHIMPYLGDLGINRTTASMAASALPLATIIGRLGFGWLADKYQRRVVALAGFAASGIGMLFFVWVSLGTWALGPFLLLFGIGWGSCVTLRIALLREYFGLGRFGSIQGLTFGVMTIGNIAGPPVAGWAFDTWGNYHGVWLAMVAVLIASVVIIGTLPRPAGASKPVPALARG